MASMFVATQALANRANSASVQNASGFLRETVGQTGITEDNLAEGSGALIQRALLLSGIVFLVLTVYAGFLWMTAQGNQERVEKARNTLIASAIGIFVIVSAFALTNFIITRFQGAATGQDAGPAAGQVGNGGAALGCCFDRAGAGPIGIWTWRMTTQEDCQRRGTDPNDPADVHFGPQDWQWDGNRSTPQCEQAFSQL